MEEANRKTLVGTVIGDTMNKTVIVSVDAPKRHPLYNKTMKRIKKYYAHDENNECKEGDTVRIEETRPMSKLKHWRVREIVTKGQVADIKPSEITN
jgi:small subunit ribosomal protein S17